MNFVPGLDPYWRLRWKWTLYLWYWQFRAFFAKDSSK